MRCVIAIGIYGPLAIKTVQLDHRLHGTGRGVAAVRSDHGTEWTLTFPAPTSAPWPRVLEAQAGGKAGRARRMPGYRGGMLSEGTWGSGN